MAESLKRFFFLSFILACRTPFLVLDLKFEILHVHPPFLDFLPPRTHISLLASILWVGEHYIILVRNGIRAYDNPPKLDKWLVKQLSDFVLPQDHAMFAKTMAELLSRRVICIWKPSKAPAPAAGSPPWSSAHLKERPDRYGSSVHQIREQCQESRRLAGCVVAKVLLPRGEHNHSISR